MNVCSLSCVFVLISCVTSLSHDGSQGLEWKQKSMAKSNKKSKELKIGDHFNFDCSASERYPSPGRQKLTVTFYKDGALVKNNNHFEMQKQALKIKNFTLAMEGNYSCVVSVGRDVNKLLTWNITVKADAKPQIIESPKNITEQAGATVSFKCKVKNSGTSIKWQKFKDSDTEEYMDIPGDNSNQEELTISNIQKSDEGIYRCRAVNVHGIAHTDAWLKVFEPITTPTTPKLNTKKIGSIKKDSSHKDRYPYTDSDVDIFNSNHFYETTKRPSKSRNKDRKPKKDKNKNKNKEKQNFDEEKLYNTAMVTVSSTTEGRNVEIWTYGTNDHEMDSSMDVHNPKVGESDPPDSTATPPQGSVNSHNYSISSWTIYTIVGAVGGVVLLIGLIAITLTVCCQREEGGIYKSTPV